LVLNEAQKVEFWRDGFLVAKNAVTPNQLQAMRQMMAGWAEESRAHTKPYGPPTIDGRARFDMGAEHSAEQPALRRVNNPSDLYGPFQEAMENSAMTEMVNELIGPNLKFHHCKINQKLPGAATEVHFHQDFPFTPHTNDDIVTALLMLDDVDEENGCLKVVPGSHKGPLHSLFEGDTFIGRMSDDVTAKMKAREVPITGKAGSVCLMHTRLAHGSDPSRSETPRGLYICVYTAADAIPIAQNPMPNQNEGRIIRGEKQRKARLSLALVELPEQPKSASFFTVQGQASATGQD
jgi:ectoine hydroxylase-related dioxygenase (phytanoyl-CoA dioxygenase family)